MRTGNRGAPGTHFQDEDREPDRIASHKTTNDGKLRCIIWKNDYGDREQNVDRKVSGSALHTPGVFYFASKDEMLPRTDAYHSFQTFQTSTIHIYSHETFLNPTWVLPNHITLPIADLSLTRCQHNGPRT